ncbi:MAG: DUF1049 domain-containing protein [Roseinatronobacter sp.]
MAFIRYAFALIVAIGFVLVSLANRTLVEVKMLPDPVADLLGMNFEMVAPLFLLLAVALAVGLFMGFIWEWLREYSLRAEAAKMQREREAMRAELERMEKLTPQARKDDVLALVDSR